MLSVWMSVLALKDTRPYYGTLRTLPTEHGRRLQAPEAGVPANYFAHRSRAAIGSTLGRRWFCSPNPDPSPNPEPKPTPHPGPSPSPSLILTRLPNEAECVSKCNGMGYGCAGFVKQVTLSSADAGSCTLVARGYGLRVSGESDFFRKAESAADARWDVNVGMLASVDVFAYKGVHGSLDSTTVECATDQKCQGFYTCVDEAANCTAETLALHASLSSAVRESKPALFGGGYTAVLLSGVPAAGNLLQSSTFQVYSKLGSQTYGGTADGASCVFPFVAHGWEFYECTVLQDSRPWCYTTKLGKWGAPLPLNHPPPRTLNPTHAHSRELASCPCRLLRQLRPGQARRGVAAHQLVGLSGRVRRRAADARRHMPQQHDGPARGGRRGVRRAARRRAAVQHARVRRRLRGRGGRAAAVRRLL